MIVLHEFDVPTDGLVEHTLVEALHEEAAFVAVLNRFDEKNIRDR
jgi:hypothetical protein